MERKLDTFIQTRSSTDTSTDALLIKPIEFGTEQKHSKCHLVFNDEITPDIAHHIMGDVVQWCDVEVSNEENTEIVLYFIMAGTPSVFQFLDKERWTVSRKHRTVVLVVITKGKQQMALYPFPENVHGPDLTVQLNYVSVNQQLDTAEDSINKRNLDHLKSFLSRGGRPAGYGSDDKIVHETIV